MRKYRFGQLFIKLKSRITYQREIDSYGMASIFRRNYNWRRQAVAKLFVNFEENTDLSESLIF